MAAFHQEFLDFFGEGEITLPGYKADQRMKAFQKAITERQRAAAGLSGKESLTELAHQADISEEEIAEVVQSMGKSARSLGGVPLPTDHETGGVKPNMVLLQDYGKVLEPDLLETASVPVHLHQLFQEAVQEVRKNQKPKAKPKRGKGFQ